MTYKTYTRTDLAALTGRPVASFPETFINASAIPQAMLLFKMGTCLASLDGLNDDQRQMVDFAIVFMADAIHLTAPYQTTKYSPFNSESIGSYSYSKAAAAVTLGKSTGVDWFDIAIQELSVCDVMDGIPMSSGIEVFNADETLVAGTLGGTKRLLTEQEMAASRRFGYDPNFRTAGIPTITAPGTDGDDGIDFYEDPENPGLFIPVGE